MAKLLCNIAETDNIVNQLYFKKIKIKKKKKSFQSFKKERAESQPEGCW